MATSRMLWDLELVKVLLSVAHRVGRVNILKLRISSWSVRLNIKAMTGRKIRKNTFFFPSIYDNLHFRSCKLQKSTNEERS